MYTCFLILLLLSHLAVIRCEELTAPTDGYIDNCETHYGTSCDIRCGQGYMLVGDGNRTCEMDANGDTYWSGSEPRCQRKYFGSLRLVSPSIRQPSL